jgi:hypothetical protein
MKVLPHQPRDHRRGFLKMAVSKAELPFVRQESSLGPPLLFVQNTHSQPKTAD